MPTRNRARDERPRRHRLDHRSGGSTDSNSAPGGLRSQRDYPARCATERPMRSGRSGSISWIHTLRLRPTTSGSWAKRLLRGRRPSVSSCGFGRPKARQSGCFEADTDRDTCALYQNSFDVSSLCEAARRGSNDTALRNQRSYPNPSPVHVAPRVEKTVRRGRRPVRH